MPMTIVSILSLFFIPIFQYCHELHVLGEKNNDEDKTTKSIRILKGMLWLNFLITLVYGLEIAMKSYAFGLRRAFSQMDWIFKAEFFLLPLLNVAFIFFIFGDGAANEYDLQVNLYSMAILIRVLRVTSILNEITLWRNFVRTLRALVKPFFNFGATLYSLYLIYASIGLEFFGGKINV
mmetsp:Transcript_7574/g.9135  ORF Transcript_7574/g.9135 Transcript_7574/m.9135 type:complete len:179 (+) Transcript_7574:2245-2781(+)